MATRAKAAKKGPKIERRGGKRPGAGRPRTVENKWWTPEAIKEAASKCAVSPLEYMLAVMNDANAHVKRRDMFAKLAAQYVHASLRNPQQAAPDSDDVAKKPKGKREQAQAEAEEVAEEGEYAPPRPPKLRAIGGGGAE